MMLTPVLCMLISEAGLHSRSPPYSDNGALLSLDIQSLNQVVDNKIVSFLYLYAPHSLLLDRHKHSQKQSHHWFLISTKLDGVAHCVPLRSRALWRTNVSNSHMWWVGRLQPLY